MRHPLRDLPRWLALLAGLYLTGLPTYYAVIEVGLVDGPARDARNVGLYLFIAWGLVALIAGLLALLDSRHLIRLLYLRQHLLIDERQRTAGLKAIELVVNERAGLLGSFKPKVYVVDNLERPIELVPLLDHDPPPLDRWPLNEGIVGRAYNDNKPDVPLQVTGDELAETMSDPARRARFASVQFVAAVVIQDVGGRRLGVLSCSSNQASGWGSKRNEQLRLLADELGVLLLLVR